MATKKIQIIPPGYTDVCYPQTVASAVIEETDKKFMTDAERTKLSGIATGATNTQNHATNGSISVNGTQQVVYAHPTADGDKHVPATGTTNNGKVLKAGATAGSLSWGSLTASDVGAVPTTRTVNGKALSANISITASDVSAYSKTEIDNKNFVYGDPVTTFENFDPINAQFLGGNSPEYYAVKAQVDSAIGQVVVQKNEIKTTTFNPDGSITEVTKVGSTTVRTKTTTFPSATQIIEATVENGITTTKTTTFNPDGTITEGVI